MIHWSDAQAYIETHGTAEGYLKNNIMIGKNNVDKLQKSGYNVKKISRYAESMLMYGRYDEVWTEYRVIQCLGG